MIAILDACVLYPAPIRDILLNLSEVGIYQAKWTDAITEEWKYNLLKNRKDLQEDKLDYTIRIMNEYFPSAIVFGYEEMEEDLNLPDKGDTHVLAAAIHCKADLIITFNLKDFPNEYLGQYNLKAIHPDDFISDLMEEDTSKVIEAFQNQVNHLKNPPKTQNEVLEILRKNGLTKTVRKLSNYLAEYVDN